VKYLRGTRPLPKANHIVGEIVNRNVLKHKQRVKIRHVWKDGGHCSMRGEK
jgi:hypothetical protein